MKDIGLDSFTDLVMRLYAYFKINPKEEILDPKKRFSVVTPETIQLTDAIRDAYRDADFEKGYQNMVKVMRLSPERGQ